MLIPFVKMQAQGNDFVILDLQGKEMELNYQDMAKDLCALHTGIGADGLVLILESSLADCKMVIYNSDGSRAEMCGSALRCVTDITGKSLNKNIVSVETDSGIKDGIILLKEGKDLIQVNMGKAITMESDICLEGFMGHVVDVGNRHFVTFCEDLSMDPHIKYGSKIEHHDHFEKAVNAQFARKVDSRTIELKIWEAACGATLACGTGATASAWIGMESYNMEDNIQVVMPGGIVWIARRDGDFWLSGDVQKVFSGEYIWKT